MLIFLGFLVIPEVDSQVRINFGRYQADSSIVVRKLGPQELNFNQRNGVILQESFGIIRIGIQDPELVVYEIEGPREMDLLIRFEWSPLRRVLTSNNLSSTPATLPLNIRAAYSNRGATSLAQALGQVVELPSYTSSVVLPILRNSIHGPPGFPPSPLSHGNAINRARMYFFIYGRYCPGRVGFRQVDTRGRCISQLVIPANEIYEQKNARQLKKQLLFCSIEGKGNSCQNH